MANKPKHLLFSVTEKDCTFTAQTAGGPGGQHRNRIKTAIRVVHHDSGATGFASDNRSQRANKEAAFERMANSETFQRWAYITAHKIIAGQSKESAAKFTMNDEDLLFEGYSDGEWHRID